jgi:tetratricopeptide (TPR) repeat protein
MFMRVVFGILLCGLVAGGLLVEGQEAAVPKSPVEPGAPTLADAKALAAKGRLDQALAELDGLSKGDPEEAGVERLRGIVLYQKERLAEAETAFAKAVQQDAEDRESIEMRGITLYRLGKPEEAIPLLEKAHAAVTGANVDPQYVLGLCYTDVKRYDDARRSFAAQFGFGADSAEAYLAAARLFLRRDFADESERFARKALELNPKLPLAHELLGEVALAKAELPQAVKELEEEEKLNPLDGNVYDRLGDAYLRNGQYEESRQALNKAVLLEPNATGPYILLGQALLKLQQPIQALHYLDRAIAMDAGNHNTHYVLAQAYSALGRSVDAHREFKLSIDLQHNSDPKHAGQAK